MNRVKRGQDMKKWILSLEKDSHVYVFVVMGLIMAAFPGYVGQAVPYLLGAGALFFGILHVAMLMMDPFAHFNTHVRILGLEIIAAALVRRKNKRES